MKLWQGRFDAPEAADADAFNESLSFDKKLWRADITASVAHATMLGTCGILTEEEADTICAGLKGIYADIERGTLPIEGQEDIHSFVEGELVARIGQTGKNCTRRARETIRWRPICASMPATPQTAPWHCSKRSSPPCSSAQRRA